MWLGDSSHCLSNWPDIGIDLECVLGEFPGSSWYDGWAPCKDFPVLTEKLDERAFLFWSEILRHKSSLGGVCRVDLMRSGVTAGVEIHFGNFLACVSENIVVCCLSDACELLLHAEKFRYFVEVSIAIV